MSRTYATPLQLDIYSSRQLIIWLTIISSLVLVSLLLVSLNFYLKFLFLLVFLIFVYQSYKNINNKKTVIWKEDNEWEIIEAGGSKNASLLASSFVSRWLTILNFKLEDRKKKTVIVFSDAINKEQFRKLRVRLKVDGL